MPKDVLGRLVPAVLNYYFIHNFHASSSALQLRRQLNRQNLTLLLMLHSSFKSLLDHSTTSSYCKIAKTKLKSTNFDSSWVELLASCWHIAFYEMTETPTATTTKCFEPLFIIILNKNRLLVWHWKYCKATLWETVKCSKKFLTLFTQMVRGFRSYPD